MRTFLILLTFSALIACNNNDQQSTTQTDLNKIIEDTTKYTTIQWDKTETDFGEIKQGDKATVKFTFTNTGDKPLFITSVNAACGCTIPSYTKGAIAPGASGEVTGEYNSAGNQGTVSKYINVTANTKPENAFRLTFTGNVKK